MEGNEGWGSCSGCSRRFLIGDDEGQLMELLGGSSIVDSVELFLNG